MATQCSLSDASKQINLNIWSFLRRLTSYEVAFDCATYHFLHGTAAVAQNNTLLTLFYLELVLHLLIVSILL
ncbi:hypothetical protein Peur_069606 [Populus x canadensis]